MNTIFHTFRAPEDIPAKILQISHQNIWFPWVSRDIPNCLAPTPPRGRPPPYRKVSPKFEFVLVFLVWHLIPKQLKMCECNVSWPESYGVLTREKEREREREGERGRGEKVRGPSGQNSQTSDAHAPWFGSKTKMMLQQRNSKNRHLSSPIVIVHASQTMYWWQFKVTSSGRAKAKVTNQKDLKKGKGQKDPQALSSFRKANQMGKTKSKGKGQWTTWS